MAAQGYLNVTAVAKLDFGVMVSASGWPFDKGWAETEELLAAGVDGTRWREIRKGFRAWEVRTMAGFTSHQLAKTEAQRYVSASGKVGNIGLTIGSAAYTWSRIHAELVEYAIINAPIVGPSVTASSVAQCRGTWRFTLTELSTVPT